MLLAGLAAVALASAFSPAANAQSKPVSNNGRIAFDIGAQSLSDALVQFSRKTGAQLFFNADLVRGKRSPGARGSLTRGEALARLFAGSGLDYRLSGNTVTLGDADFNLSTGAIEPDGSILLNPIVISGQDGTGYATTHSATGSKTDTPLIEVPQAISVVTKDQIRDQGAQNVAEALRYTAGVTTGIFGADPRYDQLTVRGFNSHFYGDYKNGLRQPTNVYALFKTEAYGLERIDVLKGPSSVLYGQGTPGGVVDRVTKKPTEEPIREVQGQFGTDRRFQGAFDFSGPVDANKEFLYRLTGVVRDADNYQHSDMPDDRRFIAPSLTWQPNEDTKLTILGDFLEEEVGWNFFYTKPDGTPTHIFTGEPSYDRYNQKQYSIGYELEHRFNEVWQGKQKLRWASLDLDAEYVYQYGSVTDGRTLNRVWEGRDDRLDSFAVDNQAIAEFDAGATDHKVLFGLDYQDMNTRTHVTNGFAPSLDLENPIYGQPIDMAGFVMETANTRQKVSQTGIYIQDQIKYNDRWLLMLGGRYDWANMETRNLLAGTTTDTDDSAFTGRIGLTYLSDIGIAPYISYATSFQPTPGTTSAARGSEPFKPTEGEQYEIGVKYEPTANSLVTLSIFDLTQTNMLTADPDSTQNFIQTGEVRSRGLELEGTADLTDNLRLRASYTYQDMEVTKSNSGDVGKRPVSVPEHQASIWGDYTIREGALDGVGFGAGVRFTGSTFADERNTKKNDSSSFVDASIHYERDGTRFAINATNLFDKEVATCASGSCYWQQGRTITGTLTRRW
ncbi:ferric siderophore receptor [Brucella endophytica]|uniref:Heme transporter BhuA n=1 Tax=Brucella endophytica TaxID=1963359 RepID=A0A916WIX9_9HYPH|nr:TonB-dependent siderophore receptor [Brucella endophytica]GGB05598.1 ferric siderophore receptor [Brucella endophytica]